MSWKPEVFIGGKWCANGLVFATEQEAAEYRRALLSTLVERPDSRVVESTDPVNYAWRNDELVVIPLRRMPEPIAEYIPLLMRAVPLGVSAGNPARLGVCNMPTITTKPEPMLWLSDRRGVYIPRDFATSFADRAKDVAGVNPEQWKILEAGPSGTDWYWEVWDEVCASATITDENGTKYSVYQDGDCWLIPKGMEWSDDIGFFAWPDKNSAEC